MLVKRISKQTQTVTHHGHAGVHRTHPRNAIHILAGNHIVHPDVYCSMFNSFLMLMAISAGGTSVPFSNKESVRMGKLHLAANS